MPVWVTLESQQKLIVIKVQKQLARISRSNIYDGNRYGSHLRGRTCINSTSKCLSYEGEDINGFWSGKYTFLA